MAMEYFSFLLILSIVSIAPQALATCPCTSPSHGHKPNPPKTGPVLPPVPVVGPIIGKPPISLPPVVPVVGPIIGKPPISLPPVVPVVGPIIGKPPITLPPLVPVVGPIIGKPPTTLPPVPVVGKPPKTPKTPGCPTPPAKPKTCPADTVKLGACLDILGSIGQIGDPAVKCCPLIEGLTSVDAALCLCTAIKLKLLGINVFLPIAVELLITCGKTPPPGYNCA